jgi:hypothetical protein
MKRAVGMESGPFFGGEFGDVLAVMVEHQHGLPQQVLVAIDRELPELAALYYVMQSFARAA